MTINNAFNGVIAWCNGELPAVTWGRAQQSQAPSPKDFPGGLGIVNLLSVTNDGRGWVNETYSSVNDNFDQEYKNSKRLDFSVNIFGVDAFARAEQLKSSVYFPQVTDDFLLANLGFVSATSTNNLTAIENGEWESRAQFDIAFYSNITYTKTIDPVDQVTIKVNADDGRLVFDKVIDF